MKRSGEWPVPVFRCYSLTMSHIHRFFVPPDTPDSGEIVLVDQEAHHALHVVRVQIGDRVLLFDGLGREIDAIVLRATRHEVFNEPACVRRLPRSEKALTICQAWLHREKSLEYLIERGTELGVARFTFFRAERSDNEPRYADKWQRAAIESCKQCGRLWLPEFEVLPDLDACLRQSAGLNLVATKDRPTQPIRNAALLGGTAISLFVGPEGDFTKHELDRLIQSGAIPISLGTATFRSEVAAALAASLILYELGQLGAADDKRTDS